MNPDSPDITSDDMDTNAVVLTPGLTVLVPTYARPVYLATSLESLGHASLRGAITRVLVGDDSGEAAIVEANKKAILDSPLAARTEHRHNTPSLGQYPNIWNLADQVTTEYLMIVHDDDTAVAGAVDALLTLAQHDDDPRVGVWFGSHLIMNQEGKVDPSASQLNNSHYERYGEPHTTPFWRIALAQTLPPHSYLIRTAIYRTYMRGDRDGAVGDLGLQVRLANAGVWGRYIPVNTFQYRVHPDSATGEGVHVHRSYELLRSLDVPEVATDRKRQALRTMSPVAARRYARAGEISRAWEVFWSADFPNRLSLEGLKTVTELVTRSLR